MPHAEVGQGIYTSSAMLIAEELEVGLDQVDVQPAPPDLEKYLRPAPARSGDWWLDLDAQRLAAAARGRRRGAHDAGRCGGQTLGRRSRRCAAPSAAWCITTRAGARSAMASWRRRRRAQPVPQRIALKDPSQFRLIGTSAKRLDTPAKVDGSAVFGIDVVVPGMKVGTLAIAR